MAWVEDLSNSVDDIFSTSFEVRDGRKIPESDDVALHNGAVKVEAAFLYADLAGSGVLASHCPWDTTSKILHSYLSGAARLIRAYRGQIRSFDGDRIMGVFMEGTKCSDAANCAREIMWMTENIITVKAKRFASVKNNDVQIHQACGIDVGTVRAVRAGIRNNNDLIWVGKAPSLAAKLSDLREYPYCTFITERVYKKLTDTAKCPEGKIIWEQRTLKYTGQLETIYRSSWMRRP